jgi:hypothetical protein
MAVTRELGVGLESCCWGSESPRWAYIALDWQVDGHDVALVWEEDSGWSAATEYDSAQLCVMAHLEGETAPQSVTVADFAATLRAESLWAQPLPAAG